MFWLSIHQHYSLLAWIEITSNWTDSGALWSNNIEKLNFWTQTKYHKKKYEHLVPPLLSDLFKRVYSRECCKVQTILFCFLYIFVGFSSQHCVDRAGESNYDNKPILCLCHQNHHHWILNTASPLCSNYYQIQGYFIQDRGQHSIHLLRKSFKNMLK